MEKSKKILKDFGPDFVIGFGGYVSAPVILAGAPFAHSNFDPWTEFHCRKGQSAGHE